MNFSPEQIIALAPDAPSAKAGRALANAGKWPALGCDERAVWGECRGSGLEPYRTQIDLNEPAFRCSCPSRKFPCKHALGLFLLHATQRAAFEQGARPVWVVEWLGKRDEQAQRKKPEAKGETPVAAVTASGRAATKKHPAEGATKTKRAAERQARVAAGLAELELWLRDMARRGLANAQTQPASYWEQVAARMVDAQAPGVARRVRELSSVSSSVEGWAEVLLARAGSLHLLVEAFKRIETLPPPVQADVRASVGWTYKEEELSSHEAVRDHWLVTGQRTYEEDNLRVRRTWLRGERCARDAAVLDFAAPGQALKSGLLAGTKVEAELIYYPGNYPLRAFVKQRLSATDSATRARGYASVEDFLAAYADALARNPWLEVFPAMLEEVVAVRRDERWLVRDAAGRQLPLSPAFAEGWKLTALCGGRPLALFGEWDGRSLRPLCVWSEGRFANLN